LPAVAQFAILFPSLLTICKLALLGLIVHRLVPLSRLLPTGKLSLLGPTLPRLGKVAPMFLNWEVVGKIGSLFPALRTIKTRH
jgi:hypothetical protein